MRDTKVWIGVFGFALLLLGSLAGAATQAGAKPDRAGVRASTGGAPLSRLEVVRGESSHEPTSCPGFEAIDEPLERIYVASDGDDSAVGSQSQPLLTLAEAANRLQQGGTVVVRGGVYPHQTGIVARGTVSNPLVFRPADGEIPIFDGSGIDYEWGSVIEFTSAQHTAVLGFEIRNGRFHRTAGIDSSEPMLDFTLRNSYIHHMASSAASLQGTDLRLEGNRVHDVVLSNEDNHAFPDGGWDGCLALHGNLSNPSNPWLSGGWIRGNHVSDCWGEGIGTLYLDDVVIEDNVVENSFNAGIYLDNSSGVEVSRNFVKIDRGLHDSSGTAILIGMEDYSFWNLPNKSSRNLRITNNVAVGGSGIGLWVMVERPESTYHKVQVVHNTVIATDGTAIGFARVNTLPAPSGNVIANNLVSEQVTSPLGNPEAFVVEGNGSIDGDVGSIDQAADARRFVESAGQGVGGTGLGSDFACEVRSTEEPTRGAFERGSGTPPGCPSGTLCLREGRFQVAVSWRDFRGRKGVGTPVALDDGLTDDSGILWFFSPGNWELLIKVIDGCDWNGHFWVLAAAATTVEYELVVTDTSTGERSGYLNPLGTPSAAITDTSAFATCP